MPTATQLNKPVLTLGHFGAEVKELQTLLNAQFFSAGLVVDGNFGLATDAAVQRFQQRMFLTVDGIVGQATWKVLYNRAPYALPQLQVGSDNDLVKRLEMRLAVNGFSGFTVDGVFTELTAAALATVQRSNGLPGTGFTDDKTWMAVCRLPQI